MRCSVFDLLDGSDNRSRIVKLVRFARSVEFEAREEIAKYTGG